MKSVTMDHNLMEKAATLLVQAGKLAGTVLTLILQMMLFAKKSVGMALKLGLKYAMMGENLMGKVVILFVHGPKQDGHAYMEILRLMLSVLLYAEMGSSWPLKNAMMRMFRMEMGVQAYARSNPDISVLEEIFFNLMSVKLSQVFGFSLFLLKMK